MSWVDVPVTKHRQVVNDLLGRSLDHHASVSATAEYDVTDLRARLRAARRSGAAASLTSHLVKATAALLREQPDLNQHLFVSWWGRQRIVRFESIDCTLIVARRHEGQDLLFPVVIRGADRLSTAEIEAIIEHHKSAPLAELEPMRALARVKRTPWLGLKLFSFLARSNPAFYLRTFGTYGLSSLVRQRGHAVSGATLANTGVAFLPGSLRELPRGVDGQVVPRDILSMGLVFDHYLFDGIAMLRAVRDRGGAREAVRRGRRARDPDGASRRPARGAPGWTAGPGVGPGAPGGSGGRRFPCAARGGGGGVAGAGGRGDPQPAARGPS